MNISGRRLDVAKDRINKLEIDQKRLLRYSPEKKKGKKQSREGKRMNDTVKRSNIHFIGVPERRKNEAEAIRQQTLAQNIPEQIKKMNLQV